MKHAWTQGVLCGLGPTLLGLAICGVDPASATVMTQGCAGDSPVFGQSCTLQELGNGGSFVIDGLRFSEFSYVPDARGPQDIYLIPRDDASGPSFEMRRDGRVLMEAFPLG